MAKKRKPTPQEEHAANMAAMDNAVNGPEQVVNVVVKRLSGKESGKLVKVPRPCTFQDVIEAAKRKGLNFGYGTLTARPPGGAYVVEDRGLGEDFPERAMLVFEQKERKRPTEFYF